MSVEVNPGQTVKHDGVLYVAGEIIRTLEADVKAELVKLGVVKDLDAVAGQVENQVHEDEHTVAGQVAQDEDLVRGEVENQVHENANADVQAALDTLAAPGEPVNQSSVPPAAAQPSAEEIAKTAESVS